jgi:ligand-binding sensor domain-containing protein
VQFVRFDHRGWLWVGTDLGVNVFDRAHWKLLTQRDGLTSNDTNEGAPSLPIVTAPCGSASTTGPSISLTPNTSSRKILCSSC